MLLSNTVYFKVKVNLERQTQSKFSGKLKEICFMTISSDKTESSQ